ncbi:MAG: hypothetical protein LBH84_04810 [Prevotellaceae bacterium]|nr:hypothetical protein [Prevotellaceae bacterium]
MAYCRSSSAATGWGSSAALARSSRAALRNDGGGSGWRTVVRRRQLWAGVPPLRLLVPRALRCGMTTAARARGKSGLVIP